MEKDSVQTSVFSEIKVLSRCRCLEHNQRIESEILFSKRRQENKSLFFVFLVENQTQWPFEEIPMSRVPRQGREGESQPDCDHSGNRPTGSFTGHLHSAPWNAHCGRCSTPDSDSSPQMTSCFFSLSCDPKILSGEAWRPCLGQSS